MIQVGDQMHDVMLYGNEEVPTGIVWDVVAVDPIEGGRFSVTLQRTTPAGETITSTMKVVNPETPKLEAENRPGDWNVEDAFDPNVKVIWQ